MSEQGRSTLATGEDGRILDRLAGLEKVISPELVRQVLQASGRVNGRACKLTHEVTIWIVLAMGLLTHMPIRQVFRHSRRLRAGEKCPARSSLCTARQRLGLEPVRALHAAVVRPLATPDTPGGFYRRWRLMAFDGTVLDVPDSAANAGFGRSCGARGEATFPQVRKTSLVELGTHIETALSFVGCFRILQCHLPECDSRTPASLQHWYQALLAELRSEQIGPRRNRIHPRVIKRKMSQWNKKQPHHRRPPPLLKTFEQCIVMKT